MCKIYVDSSKTYSCKLDRLIFPGLTYAYRYFRSKNFVQIFLICKLTALLEYFDLFNNLSKKFSYDLCMQNLFTAKIILCMNVCM